MQTEDIQKAIDEILAKNKRIVIAIAGGSCSGKTRLAKKIAEQHNALVIGMDDYYRGGTATTNYDVPSSVDLDMLADHLENLKKGASVRKPVYDMKTHSRSGYRTVSPGRVMICDGIFALHEKIRKHADLRVFIDSPEKRRFERRLRRDVAKRGRTPDSVKRQFTEQVEPAFLEHVLPAKKYADIVVNN